MLLVFWRLTLPAAETAAEETAAAGEKTTAHHKRLDPALGHKEIIFDTLVPKLLRHIETHGSILVVDLLLVLVTEDGVGVVDFFEFLSSFWVIWVLIRVMPQCQLPVRPFYFFLRCSFLQAQDFVQTVSCC